MNLALYEALGSKMSGTDERRWCSWSLQFSGTNDAEMGNDTKSENRSQNCHLSLCLLLPPWFMSPSSLA